MQKGQTSLLLKRFLLLIPIREVVVTHKDNRNRKKSLLWAFTIVVAVLLSFSSFITMLTFVLIQRENQRISDKYRDLERNIERFFYSYLGLLQNFEAYIKTLPSLNEQAINTYFEHVLAEDKNYILSINIVEDTTVLWSFPKETNRASLGINLAEVKDQKEAVLKVKRENTNTLYGPCECINGCEGFFLRVPILEEDNSYWGQSCIVFKKDALIDLIRSYAESSNLNLSIYSGAEASIPFVTSDKSFNRYMAFNIDPSLINWKVHIDLTPSYTFITIIILPLLLLSLVIAGLTGFFTYSYAYNYYNILNMSKRDYLTGLYNRHYLDTYQKKIMKEAKNNKERIGFLTLDLNGFKDINDTYGHEVGDKTLVELTRILKEVKTEKECIFRLGGDEFLIIVPNLEEEKDLLDKVVYIRERLCGYYNISGNSILVKVGLGHAIYPDEGKDFEDLLRRADQRMYQDKRRTNRS